LTIFRLPARALHGRRVASRSGEAGGDENGQTPSPSASEFIHIHHHK